MSTKITGVPQALKILKDIDPALRREAVEEMRSATQPLIAAARARVPESPARGWSKKGRLGFSPGRVRQSIRPQFRSNKRRGSERFTLVNVVMSSPGGSMFDMAGKPGSGNTKSGRELIRYLNAWHGRGSRIMWPAAEQELPAVARAVEAAARRVEIQASRLAARR